MKNKIIFSIFYLFIFSIYNIFGFTLAVIPDTQNYVNYRYQIETAPNNDYPINHFEMLEKQFKYITDNSVLNGGDIVFAIHLGDVVMNTNKESEWILANKAMELLDDKIPYSVAMGNHDYDAWIYDDSKKFQYADGFTKFEKYFGPETPHFKGKEYYKDSCHFGANSYTEFYGDGILFGVLTLEVEPDDDCLAWAQKVLTENKNTPIILATHEFLLVQKKGTDSAKYSNSKIRTKVGGNSPKQLFNKLISKNNQIFMVLCGHQFEKEEGEGLRIDFNDDGYPVYELLSNYQGRKEISNLLTGQNKHSGDGWFRLMDFDLDKKEISVKTYSTELLRYEEDEDSQFTLKIDWNWGERFNNE